MGKRLSVVGVASKIIITNKIALEIAQGLFYFVFFCKFIPLSSSNVALCF